ncbi:trans-4-hydroxy-L-proline dehydratase activase [Proteocatella sphenisci]|uniref:trans-4-hydroxy-L-proline dehydratase activase n=1 Tax=Proteocatella sphenisci TaxID=181070 RepID=UPI00048B25A1|nr:trans-4-hydroxy-L-proline dehydratase activase [Proteocatella sphenisci]
MKNLVFNIQKYSIHDGEGIRTTIFFKGCPMDCKWCHNPESQAYTQGVMYNAEKCVECGNCISKCPQDAISIKGGVITTSADRCNFCESCTDACLNNAREIAGKAYTVDEIMKEIEKDKMFYDQSNGGVTLSGGEVMTQDMNYILGILKKCNRMGYRVNIDTCGHASFENFEKIMPYVDTFLYDIKHMDNELHKELTGQGNELVLGNLAKLSEKGAKINIRMPLVEGINADDEHIGKVIDFLSNLKIEKVNLLPYHNTGKSKYERMGIRYEGDNYTAPDAERMEMIRLRFEKNNFNAKIGG